MYKCRFKIDMCVVEIIQTYAFSLIVLHSTKKYNCQKINFLANYHQTVQSRGSPKTKVVWIGF